MFFLLLTCFKKNETLFISVHLLLYRIEVLFEVVCAVVNHTHKIHDFLVKRTDKKNNRNERYEAEPFGRVNPSKKFSENVNYEDH